MLCVHVTSVWYGKYLYFKSQLFHNKKWCTTELSNSMDKSLWSKRSKTQLSTYCTHTMHMKFKNRQISTQNKKFEIPSVATCISSLLVFIATWLCHSSFIHSPVYGHLGFFRFCLLQIKLLWILIKKSSVDIGFWFSWVK